ncbi:DUF4350 domain-containing protein [Geobacter sp. DSM 9736]|uniref:DUF4350 domain-containing protein n=1 Tax=Geobacter sp. DSM 9736 TaxID=1277350 RepID=UPI000B50B3DB|nr:DUF4350 domain-containing protein [Geobacter sp. DSM 9736]SNB44867.1 hypothetical protein SAMN06269301_0257 [Geobacter sp. DSM 9736]
MKPIIQISLLLTLALIVPVSATAAEAGAILIDEGHDQRFLMNRESPLDLSEFAARLRRVNSKVAALHHEITPEALAEATGLVLSGPFKQYSDKEIEAIVRFVEKGGKLAIMLHIAQPLTALLHRLDVDFSNGTLRETENAIKGNPQNFRVQRLSQDSFTRGIEGFSLHGAWALACTGDPCTVIAETGDRAWIDLDGSSTLSGGDAVQRFAVAVTGKRGKGEFLVFGDDALFQNKFLDAENALLADRLAAWLAD